MASTTPNITITTGEMVDYLKFIVKSGRVPCFWGHPGIGKTAIIEQFAKDTGMQTFVFVGSTREPTEVVMEMFVDEATGKVSFKKPDWQKVTGPALLFIDEANRCIAMMQNALLRVVNERKVGDTPLPPNLAIAMACNYESDGGGIAKMNSAFGSRVWHGDTVSDLDVFRSWGANNGIAPVILAYLGFRPEDFHRFNPVERTFPGPRTWHMLSDMYNQNPPSHMLPALAAGCVGQEAGLGFCTFESMYRKMSAHSVDALLMDPANYPVPTNNNELYALTAAIAHRMDVNNVDACITYLNRLGSEYNIYAVKTGISRHRELQNTHSYTTWFVKNQGKM